MNFLHLAYWQEKAKNLAIETRLFINGEYCAAADNTTFETIDPAAQQTLAQVARGKKADVERAVKAARQAFDNGDWSQASPAQRKAILTRFADLMEAHREELALLETLDTGKPIRHSLRDDIPGAARAIRWYAEALDKVYGEVAPTGSNELAMIVREPIGVIAAVVQLLTGAAPETGFHGIAGRFSRHNLLQFDQPVQGTLGLRRQVLGAWATNTCHCTGRAARNRLAAVGRRTGASFFAGRQQCLC